MGTDRIIDLIEEKGLITRENIAHFFEGSSKEETGELKSRMREALSLHHS